jgi:hypothetical protein
VIHLEGRTFQKIFDKKIHIATDMAGVGGTGGRCHTPGIMNSVALESPPRRFESFLLFDNRVLLDDLKATQYSVAQSHPLLAH